MTFEYFFSNSELKLAVFREGVPEIMCDFSGTEFCFKRYFHEFGTTLAWGNFHEFLYFCKFWGESDFVSDIFLDYFTLQRSFEDFSSSSFERVVDQDELFYFQMIFERVRRI